MSAVTDMQGKPYQTTVSARWGDMDTLGHVNNARFFTYDEDVRLAFFSHLMAGDAGFWTDYGLILARISCDFMAQVKAPVSLDIAFGITRIGRSSLETQALMHVDGKAVACTRATVVWFDYKENRSLPIPEQVRHKLMAFQVAEASARG